jgi:DNA-binding NtrC family response regulator
VCAARGESGKRFLQNEVESIDSIEVMRVDDLEHSELLELDPEGGTIRFAGQRALLVDAVAMGLLRKYLVENFGVTAARHLLTQFGFAHGWRSAEALRAEYEWENEQAWRDAGARIYALEGLFRVADPPGAASTAEKATLLASYEAEQHVVHFGIATEPVCWTICGLMSGYLSRTAGREIYVLEEHCAGRGDATCRLVARTRAEWGAERADDLHYFEPGRLADCLDVSLQRVTDSLKAVERRLRARRRALVSVAEEAGTANGIVTRSTAMTRLIDLARRVARVDSTVLITGETGSGKERIARLVHDASSRSAGPFVAVNCGAITDSLLESELFGHVRGAFTGASQDRPGLFEAANGGTLLLDEVGEISAAMQVKLLRVLQEREIRRVGESANRRVDVRILAATHRDLTDAIKAGAFRQDLFYRLNVVELRVPALRDRRDDILPLARVFLAGAAGRARRKVVTLAPRAADQLLHHAWPGNVRELENAVERAVVLSPGTRVELEDLPEEVRRALPRVVSDESVRPLEDIEREYILAALARNGGNQTVTAVQLRIGAATLYRKLKRYGAIATSRRKRGGAAPS